MRVDISLGVPGRPDDGEDPIDGIIAGSTMGAMLARMAFDYPDQMLARIKTDHGDGTYTCDRPGTNILMKMVPSNSPELAEQLAVGMTVVIKFYNRDRRKPFIWRAGGFEEVVAAMLWPRVTGNVRNSFSADANYDFDASMSEVEILSSDHEGDDYGAGSVILGYTIAGVEYMAVLTRASDGKVIVVGFDLADPTTPAFFSDPGDGTTGLTGTTFSHQMNPLAFHFCEDTSQLVVIDWFSSPGRVILLDAVTGEIDLDNSATPITGNLTGAGCGVVGSLLISLSFFFAYDAAYSRSSSAYLAKVRAYALADLSEEWVGADLLELFSAVDYPTAVDYPIIRSHLRLTGGRAYAFGPGAAPAHGADAGLIYFATAGRDGKPNATTVYPAAYSVSDTIPDNYANYVPFDNFQAAVTQNRVSSDAYTVRAWLVALDEATGEIAHQYDFPPLAAVDNYMVDTASFTFTVDASSLAVLTAIHNGAFSTINQSLGAMPTALSLDLSTGSYATSGHADWEPYRPIIKSLSASYNTRTWAKHSAAEGTSPANIAGQQYLYPHYEFWPDPSGYYFDPVPYLERGSSTGVLTYTTPPAIYMDDDGNLYLSYIRGKQIISCRHSASGDPLAAYKITAAAMSATTSPDGTLTVEWFGTPRIYTMYRSFLVSFTPQLALRWSVETTQSIVDTEDSSWLSLPHGSFVFRMIPSSDGLYVLRTERTADFSSLPIGFNSATIANAATYTRDYMNSQYTGWYNVTAGDHEPLIWAKLILELRDASSGSVIWSETLYDPSGSASPMCVPAADMFANGSGGVQGRFDYAAATWGAGGAGMNYGNYSLGTATGTMFSATAAGAVSTRAATTEDPQASGTNKAADLKTRVNTAHAMLGGQLYYNGWSAADSKWVISRLVAT